MGTRLVNREPLALAAAAATGVQVGAAIVASRFVIDQTGPFTLALIRYAIGATLLAPIVLALPGARIRFAARDLLPIALLGIGQFGVLIALLNFGLRFLPAGPAALVFATFPLLTMILAAALGQERMTLAKTGGVILTIAGVGLTLGHKALVEPTGGGFWLGVIAVLGAALTGATCSILYRPYLRRYPALTVGFVAMIASVAALAVGAGAEGFFRDGVAFTPAGWGAVVFIGASSAIGYFTWLWALGNTSPTRATMFQSLGPVTATFLGIWLLGEPARWTSYAGLVAVAAGLWVALVPRTRRQV